MSEELITTILRNKSPEIVNYEDKWHQRESVIQRHYGRWQTTFYEVNIVNYSAEFYDFVFKFSESVNLKRKL